MISRVDVWGLGFGDDVLGCLVDPRGFRICVLGVDVWGFGCKGLSPGLALLVLVFCGEVPDGVGA